MVKISSVIENSFLGFINEFGLKITDQKEKGTWSRTVVEGRDIRIKFYAEVVDHYSSSMIVLDNNYSFNCLSVARRYLGAEISTQDIERKREKYKEFDYGELLQEIEFCCDFIITYFRPLFKGEKIDLPKFSNHTEDSDVVEIDTYSVINWIKKHENN